MLVPIRAETKKYPHWVQIQTGGSNRSEARVLAVPKSISVKLLPKRAKVMARCELGLEIRNQIP